MTLLIAIAAASAAWFIAAGALFFNPVVDPVYRSEEGHPSVRNLPQTPGTIARILLAVIAQSALWAVVFTWIAPSLPEGLLMRGLSFGGILVAVKIIPRDIDRLLLTTYPPKRMTIEAVAGVICALVVGWVFAALL